MSINIPNIITILRLTLVPVFVYLFFKFPLNSALAASVFVFAGVTDVVDGYLARKLNQVTDWGKVMDPLADKLMQLAVITCLAVANTVPIWALIIIATKEIAMIVGGVILYKKNVIVAANWYGKVATALFYLCMVVLIVFKGINQVLLVVILFFAVASSIFSLFMYARLRIKSKTELENSDK